MLKEFDRDYVLTDLLLEENSKLILTSNRYFSPLNVVIFEDEYTTFSKMIIKNF